MATAHVGLDPRPMTETEEIAYAAEGKVIPEIKVVKPHCSACGSDAPHHVQYVAQHGLCVV